MRSIYTVEFEGVAVTAAVDLFEIRPATDKPVEIHALQIYQSTDLGDAAEEILRYRIIRGNTTTGTGGAAPTPIPMNSSDVAAGFGADTCNTTAATAGTAVNLHSGAFNIRVGENFWWTPESRPQSKNASGFLCVRLMAAPADSLTMSGTIYVEELG